MQVLLSEILKRFPSDVLEIQFGSLHSELQNEIPIEGLAPLSDAHPGLCSFLSNEKYLSHALETEAGFVLCSAQTANAIRSSNKNSTLIVCKDAYVMFARLGQIFFQPQKDVSGVHSLSYVDSTSQIHETATIYPFAFVGPGTRIGARTILYSGCFVGAGSIVGDDCLLYPNVVVREGCTLGNNCILNPGAVVGGDGFGFAPFEMENVKIPQIGGVQLADHVELGSNTCVDRGALKNTIVGEQTKIDSLVMVAHNVEIGKACFLAGQSGIAGSSVLGNRVVLAGQVGVSGHIAIGDNVTMLAQSGASKNIAANQIMNGSPAKTNREHLLQMATLSKITQERKLKSKA
jgi:UDP-3-O-[3-hydroxymyristoyl] glucosamine N-acyltransferase